MSGPIVLNIHGGLVFGDVMPPQQATARPAIAGQTRQDMLDGYDVVLALAEALAHADEPREMTERIYAAMTSPQARRLACGVTFRRVFRCVAEVARLTLQRAVATQGAPASVAPGSDGPSCDHPFAQAPGARVSSDSDDSARAGEPSSEASR